MESLEAIVTYTKEGHKKKNRRYLDGTLSISVENRKAILYSEDKEIVAQGKIPADIEIKDDSDEFILEAPSIQVVIVTLNKQDDHRLERQSENHGSSAFQHAVKVPIRRPTSTLNKPIPRRPFQSSNHEQAPETEHGCPPSHGCCGDNGDGNFASHLRPPPFPASFRKRPQRSASDIMRLLSGAPVSGKGNGHGDGLGAAVSTGCHPQQQQQQQLGGVGVDNVITLQDSYRRHEVHEQPVRQQNVATTPLPLPQPPLPDNKKRPRLATTINIGPPTTVTSSWRGGNPSTINTDNNTYTNAAPTSQQHNQGWINPTVHASPFLERRHEDVSASPYAVLGDDGVLFPTDNQASNPRRCIAVPDRFTDLRAYQHAWRQCLYEEITLLLTEVAKDFYAVLKRQANASVANNNVQQAQSIEIAMRKARVPYYSHCELFIWKNYPGSKKQKVRGTTKKRNSTKQKNSDGKGFLYNDVDEADDAGDNEVVQKPENTYLILKSGRVKNEEHSKGDVWVISNNPLFKNGFDPGQVGDRSRMPFCAIVKSLWFGPNQDGKFEVEFISPRPHNLGRSTPIYAMKGPNASIELAILDLLHSESIEKLPLLPYILNGMTTASDPNNNRVYDDNHGISHEGVPPTSVSAISTVSTHNELLDEKKKMSPSDHANDVISEFKLNPEQASVLHSVARWWTTQDNSNIDVSLPPPICLCFGPFGCGKSTLLVAILHLVLSLNNPDNNRLKKDSGPLINGKDTKLRNARVLVSAHTNVAVDRVLVGLMETGCTEFLRVGPLKKIHKALLPYSLHATESKAHASAAQELKDMLKEGRESGTLSASEEVALREELSAVERGAERQRKKLLKTVPIVGVTCCSSLLSTLDNLEFDIVILDECSQITEPLAMAPIIRSKCKYLIATGDPRQLPPRVADPPTVLFDSSPLHGLSRPIFVRLSSIGFVPHFLRRQYRCHPAISSIPNSQFYQGQLIDGCTPHQRPSLLKGLPPVVCIHINGKEERNMRSICNSQEARAVVRVLLRAYSEGVDPNQCGVVCFYRAQVAAVKVALHQRADELQAAIDKAFNENNNSGDNSPENTVPSPLAIQCATVDSFQGAEKDLIILTTATTRPGAFAGDECRLNVALTRAKQNLILIGNMDVLTKTAPAFARLIASCRREPGGYSVSGDVPQGIVGVTVS